MPNGRMVIFAENVAIPTIAREKLRIHEDALNARLKNLQQPEQYFTIASSRFTKPFILPGTFAKEKKRYPLMNLPGDCRSGR